MKIMALDYGKKTVGVALSDDLMLTAQAFETIERDKENKLRKTIRRLEEIIKLKKVTKIILGNPLNMDDTEGERSKKTKEFLELLKSRIDIEIELYDERLTTYVADEILLETKVDKKDRKKYVDQVAACLILEDYMSSRKKEYDRNI